MAAFGSLVLIACSSARESFVVEDAGAAGIDTREAGAIDAPAETSTSCVPAAGNYDVPGNNCDDDGDGKIDNPPGTCDDGLVASGSAEDFAKALGICAIASKDGYGLVSAKFTRGGGIAAPQPDQHGILPKFGNVMKPREGSKLGVLSTGYAQEYNGAAGRRFGGENLGGDESSKNWGTTGSLPPGFPKALSGCVQASEVHDVIALELTLKAPKNASGLRFDLSFFSSEWPAYVCSKFNDGFIAHLSAKSFNGGRPDNIAFGIKNDSITVNNAFFDRCTPNVDTGCAPGAVTSTSQCLGGTDELRGTGYGVEGKWCELYTAVGGTGGNKVSTNGGSTGWLTSSAPVGAGEELTLELVIWDTGDGALDSSVLLDNFRWATGSVTVGTVRP